MKLKNLRTAGLVTLGLGLALGGSLMLQSNESTPDCWMELVNGTAQLLPGRTTRWTPQVYCPGADNPVFTPPRVEWRSADSTRVFVWGNGGGLMLTVRPGFTEVGARWVSPAGDTLTATQIMDVRKAFEGEDYRNTPLYLQAHPAADTQPWPCSVIVSGSLLGQRSDTAFFVHVHPDRPELPNEPYCLPPNVKGIVEYNEVVGMEGELVKTELISAVRSEDYPGYTPGDTVLGAFPNDQ